MNSTSPAAKAFVDALVRLDFDAMAATLNPNVQFRALVPGELINLATAAETVQTFRRWLGGKKDGELLHYKSQTLANRLLLEYGFRLRRGEQRFLVEQRVCCTVENDQLAAIDLLCSGLRPDGAAKTPAQAK
jgi:hypothetical protein